MIFSLAKYERIKLPGYEYPVWAELIGWFLALSSMLCIPVYAIYKWTVTPGTFDEKFALLVRPTIDVAALRPGGVHDDKGDATKLEMKPLSP